MSAKKIKLLRTGFQNGHKNRGIIWCIAFIAILLLAPQVMALPSYLKTFEKTYPAAAGSRIDACNLCHDSPGGGDARNSYGLSYASSGRNFAAIENTDSDGDGYTNLEEIQNLTFPGDANDHQTTQASKSPGFEAIGTIIALFAVLIAIASIKAKCNQK